MVNRRRSVSAIGIGVFVATAVALAPSKGASQSQSCVNLSQNEFHFQGTLQYRIFPGPPNFEDVRRGDSPEPAYILKLPSPICVIDNDISPDQKFDTIQLLLDQADSVLPKELRSMVGGAVFVGGKSAFTAHTGHHHAPLLLTVTSLSPYIDPTRAYGTPMTVVQAFYLALGAGHGAEAAQFVVPGKRRSGPLSAAAIDGFYGNLVEPLRLLDISAIASDEYQVRYTFVAVRGQQCNGTSIVKTAEIDGANFIASIRSLSGC
jgi:hypothetical protein